MLTPIDKIILHNMQTLLLEMQRQKQKKPEHKIAFEESEEALWECIKDLTENGAISQEDNSTDS